MTPTQSPQRSRGVQGRSSPKTSFRRRPSSSPARKSRKRKSPDRSPIGESYAPQSPSSNSDSSLSSVPSRSPTPVLALRVSPPPPSPPTLPVPPCSSSLDIQPDHGQAAYLTPSPTPSTDTSWDASDVYIDWTAAAAEDPPRPTAVVEHIWSSPSYPPEVRFLRLKNDDQRIYALHYKLIPHFERLDWIPASTGRGMGKERVVLPEQAVHAVRKREWEIALGRQLQLVGSCHGWEWS